MKRPMSEREREHRRRESDRGTWGCLILLVLLAISPIVWIVALIGGQSDLEESMRIPAVLGVLVVGGVALLLWRMSVEPGQPRLWKQVSRPAGVHGHSGPTGALWSGAPRPDPLVDSRDLRHCHEVTVEGRTVYGFVAVDTDSRAEDWLELCELPYALPDLDMSGSQDAADVRFFGGPGRSGEAYASDIATPAVVAALTGTALEVRIRGRFLVVRHGKQRPREYLESLVADAPRLAALAVAIPQEVYLRWSPQARNAQGGGTGQWKMWDPGSHGQIQDPPADDPNAG